MNNKFLNQNGNIELTDKQLYFLTKITGLSNKHKVVYLFDESSDKWEDCGLILEMTNSRAIRVIFEGSEFKNLNLMDIVFNNIFKNSWSTKK